MESKNKIGIIGLGYVGLPLAIQFSKKKISVLGFDIDNEKLSILRKGKSYINHIKNSDIKKFIGKNFIVSSDFKKIKNVKNIILCLPTPINKNKKPELSYINNTIKTILPYLRKGQCISLESSTYPGCTRDLIVNKLKKKFSIGKNFYILYSPEREDPGTSRDLTSIPKVIGGYSTKCLKIGLNLYSQIFKTMIPVSSLEAAEMTKLLENIYRSVNIGLVNEMKIISGAFGLDIYEIISAAKTKPFGFSAFYPGPGVGGHCIPVDPFYLAWKSKQIGVSTRFIELAGKVNDAMPKWIVAKILGYKSINSILILGIAYKKNVDDYRESPILKIFDLLIKNNFKVEYHDPHIPEIKKTRKYTFNKKSINISKKRLNSFDAVILGTDHDKLNYNLISKYSKKIFDLRGRLSKKNQKKIINL